MDEIWKACEGKHDSITRTLYDILIVISSNMSKETLATLYKKIKAIDFKNYNELTLNLLKEFCENVVNLPENSKFMFENIEIEEDFVEEHYFGVNILWKLILDESPLSSTLNEEALLIFKNLIFNSNFRPLRKYYLMKSIKEIEKGSSIAQSIYIIIKIIQTNYTKKTENETQIKGLLYSYEKNFSLLTLLLRDLSRYFNKIKTTKQEIYNNSPSIFDEYFEGKHSHRRNIEVRLNLLEYFVSHNLIDENHLETLWEIFVLNAMNYQESVTYFKWLAKQNENAKGEFQIILNKLLTFYQFKRIICDPVKNNFKNMREESFNLFYLFFLMVNGYERVLRFNKTGKLVIFSQNYQGLSVLWQIFNETENEKVIEKCADLLTDLHLRISHQNPNEEKQKKKETAEKFTTFVMDLIKEAYNQSNKLMINKSVYLLIMFFEKFEGKFFKSTARATNNYYHFLNATVVLRPDNLQKEIRINIYDQIGNFRKKISEEFEIPLNQFRLIRKNNDGVVDSDDDEMTLREFGLGGVYFICKKKNDNEENYHPKHLISESQEYLDLLFRLLSESEAGHFFK